jgi:hypothetical protein
MASRHLLPEQQNFVCLSLASVDECRGVLGDILHSQIPPEDLFQKIQCKSTLLTGNQKLSPEQLKLCFIPGPVVPNYSCFDTTLLYKLIRNICPTLQPTQGWGQKPHHTDVNIGDDIERLRFLRNEIIAHAESSSVQDDIFDSTWNELENTFMRIRSFLALQGITSKSIEQLASIRKTDFGWKDYEKCEIRLMFDRMTITNTPKLTLQGDKDRKCGESACFLASYGDSEMSNNWIFIWQKLRGTITEQLDIGAEKYKGSSNMMLQIPKVVKEDQGEYRVIILREEKGTQLQIPSNSISIVVTGGNKIFKRACCNFNFKCLFKVCNAELMYF